MSHPIDFVIMWVDGNDPAWQQKKKQHTASIADLKQDDSIVRYRDWDNLELWIQSVEVFAPWVNRIYLLTDNQRPAFVAKYSKVTLVDHTEYIPKEYLPTFNSHTIELNAHRIQGLSEHFVLFNDDMFLIRPTQPEDFFEAGKPKDLYAANVVGGIGVREIIQNITLNNVSLINEHFNKRVQMKQYRSRWFNLKNGRYLLRTALLMPWGFFTGFVEPHVANSYLKSTFETVWNADFEALNQTCSHKFRDISDVNQWVMRYWQLAAGISINRSYKFGMLFDIEDSNEEACQSWIINQKSAVVCINDKASITDFEATKTRINNAIKTVIEKEG